MSFNECAMVLWHSLVCCWMSRCVKDICLSRFQRIMLLLLIFLSHLESDLATKVLIPPAAFFIIRVKTDLRENPPFLSLVNTFANFGLLQNINWLLSKLNHFAHIQQSYRDNAIEKEAERPGSSYTVTVHETKGSVSDLVFHDIEVDSTDTFKKEWSRLMQQRLNLTFSS